ncbi:MAG: Cyclopropane-fatty-acyl-phospholipid synthase [uncultured bacterium (gcode 4)]|uniref:Cyclopropane-fatty-acyl-phospholipid synthase n=1 Tax=uncultured bacterium (gcode 4) TaxID=1234023 RepID=K2FUS3_9BACT|nr:MAG: Cyclopropane-fatty-acyl-phospholipid synthase [uncultured bacterium (gcode 4)]
MYTDIFVRICKIYTDVFPENSFQFYFDWKKQHKIWKSKNIVTVKFHNTEKVFARIFKEWSIWLGESYCEWNIEVEDGVYKDFLFILVRVSYNSKKILWKLPLLDIFRVFKVQFSNKYFSRWSQEENINSHYSLSDWFDDENNSNKFYLEWLNSWYIQYSCGKWDKWIDTLEKAQLNKLDFYAKRLWIDSRSKWKTLLDLGCGWWWMMFYMAEKYSIKCVWYTLSVAQAKYINGEIKKRKLDDLVSVELKNIHNIKWKYDYIVSVGVMEHIRDYNDLYKKISFSLKKNWITLIHSMFQNQRQQFAADPFLTKYIFPGWAIPQIKKNLRIFRKYFKHVDKNDLPDKSYPKTINCWYENFCKNEDKIRKLLIENWKIKNPDYAIRVFKHYLASVYCWLYEYELVSNILAHN